MAALGIGAGSTVTAQMDADLLLGLIGDIRLVLKVGKQMEAAIDDNNTVQIHDGVAISRGRYLYIAATTYDEFKIETGEQNKTRYDIIGYRLYKSEGEELCEEFVRKDVGETGVIEEESFRDGADEVYISMYKVKIEGLTITGLTPLFERVLTPVIDLQTQITGGASAPSGGSDGDVYIQYTE